MTLDRIILENFLTYDHLDYKIPKVPMQIQGRNLTEEDQESNGSGKSGILTAIEYCIAASNSRDVLDKELVTFGYDESNIQLYASCNVRKEEIHISWTIKIKGSNILKLSIKKSDSDWKDVSFSNTNDGKKYILSWFAISKDDLFNYYIVNKQRFKSFFKSSNSDKIALINRFSDASIIDGIEKIDNTNLQDLYNTAFTNKSKIEGKIESNEERLLIEKSRDFKKEYDDRIEDIKETIDILDDKIKQKRLDILDKEKDISDLDEERLEIKKEEKELNQDKEDLKLEIKAFDKKFLDVNSDLTESKNNLESFVDTDFNKERKVYDSQSKSKKEELEATKEDYDELNNKENKILSLLNQISIKLDGSITCPKCSHEFILDGNISDIKNKQLKAKQVAEKIDKAKEKAKQTMLSIETSIESIRDSISKINSREKEENSNKNLLNESLNKVKSKINELHSQKQLVQKKIDNIDSKLSDCESDYKQVDLDEQSIKNDIKAIEGEINNIKDQIESKKDSIKDIKVGNNKDILKEIKLESIELKKQLDEKSSEVIDIESKIAERNEWSNNFKQFKLHIANKSLEVIEYHCNRYLKGMNSDLRVKLEGYKVLSSGKIKDEITTKIVRGGERSFSSFSGGEQGRLLFSSILANRHMLNSTHPYGGLDFLSVDEVFEGIDSLGLKSLIQSAKELEIAVLIVTHVTDENVSDDVLLIEKINGISKIKNR